MKIVLAVNNEQIQKKIYEIDGIEIIGIYSYKNELINGFQEALDNFGSDEKEIVLLVSPFLFGEENLFNIMLNLKASFGTKLRLVYLHGEINKKDLIVMTQLNALISLGVYDIYTEPKLTEDDLIDLIFHKRTELNVNHLIMEQKHTVAKLDIENREEIEDTALLGYSNMMAFSSIKPGTGKSFVSSNVATALAKYGQLENGKQPKVCIIESDLQTLSVGTLLKMENHKYNLKTAMSEISKIMKNGKLTEDRKEIAKANDFILKCILKHPEIENLYALTGSQLTIEEIEGIKPEYYEYLIKSIIDRFDYIIVDTNSSIHHTTTYPLLKMASKIFYILDLDFNNIRNNIRYKETLKDLDVDRKVKYVLNQDIPEEEKDLYQEPLLFDSYSFKEIGLDPIAKIPVIDKSIFLNKLVSGTPIMLDDNDNTLKARLEITKVASEICNMSNLASLENNYKFYLESIGKKKARKRQ